jgi:hypothetical protein
MCCLEATLLFCFRAGPHLHHVRDRCQHYRRETTIAAQAIAFRQSAGEFEHLPLPQIKLISDLSAVVNDHMGYVRRPIDPILPIWDINRMNFRDLDLNLLLVLKALFEERSVTAVARRLKVSQPTVSSSLSKLRLVLVDELFVRTATGMQPTARAEELHEPLRQIIETIEREILRSTAFAPSNTTQTFTVPVSDIGELVLVPPVLARLRAVAPQPAGRLDEGGQRPPGASVGRAESGCHQP